MKNKQLGHDQHQVTLKRFPVCFLAHNFVVPMNIGSLFRIADAFAVEKLYLSGTSPVPPNSKINKTSRSSEKYVPYAYEKNPLDVIKKLKAEGYTIVSLEITSASTDIRDLSVSSSDKVCLILGSESTGVCQTLLDVSDKTIHIAMLGRNSSLNVATACSIATFEIIKRFLP